MTEVSHVYAGVVRSVEGGRGGVFRQAAGEERWEALTEGLPDETEVLSGHGPATTIGAERRSNPYLTGLGEASGADPSVPTIPGARRTTGL